MNFSKSSLFFSLNKAIFTYVVRAIGKVPKSFHYKGDFFIIFFSYSGVLVSNDVTMFPFDFREHRMQV